MDTETLRRTDLVPVSLECESMQQLYQHVSDEFHATLSQHDYKVCKMWRVQNLELWDKYLKYVAAD